MKIKRLIHTAAAMTALFTLSGCIQDEITVHVKSDGSGTIVEESMLSPKMSAMLEGMAGMMQDPNAPKQAKNPLDEMADEGKAKEKAAKMGEGVTLVKIEKIEKDGGKGVRTTWAFKDVNKLKLSMNGGALDDMSDAMPGGAAAKKQDNAKGDPIRFQLDGNTLTILMPKPKADAEPAKAPENPGNMEIPPQAQAMFADMKVAFRVVAEPGIKKTNATHVEGNTVTLMEMNFGELMNDKEGWKKFQKLQGKNPEEIGEALKDVKGVKFETKEKIEIEMK